VKVRVGILVRPDLVEGVKLARKLLKVLSKEDVVLEKKLAQKLGKRGVSVDKMRVDAIVTIGGDGTVLFAHQQLPDVPILGINMGGRGFLADVAPSDAVEAIRKMTDGRLPMKGREMLATNTSGKRLPDALNEVVISSATMGKSLAFKVLVDGEVAMDTQGDGVIVATPTGSTAYALAAGGPVVDPHLDVFVIVPVCATRPRVSPLVVPMASKIKIELTRPDRKAFVFVDGQRVTEVGSNDEILLYRSEKLAKFYKWRGEFYQKVREKL
jgi:NAD+ kinase